MSENEDGPRGRVPGIAEHGRRPASPSASPFALSSLDSSGFIEVVILKSETRDGMRKAYQITGKGKKMVPLFKRLEDAENEILEKAKE